MSTWPHPIVDQLQSAVGADEAWKTTLQDLSHGNPAPYGVHVAVLIEPYLRLILDGDKTVESRFARRRYPPYGCLRSGDVILLKRTGGPIMGICQATEVSFHERHDGSWQPIRDVFAQALCAVDEEFWQQRETTSYATLVVLSRVCRLAPSLDFHKRDRRGWMVLQAAGRGEGVAR
jgi:hypothetical protein